MNWILLILTGIVGIILGTLLFALSSYVTMLVWNVLASYFGFKVITFYIACWVTLGLSILSGYFKSFNDKK